MTDAFAIFLALFVGALSAGGCVVMEITQEHIAIAVLAVIAALAVVGIFAGLIRCVESIVERDSETENPRDGQSRG